MAGGMLTKTKELPAHRICVVRHQDNVSILRGRFKPQAIMAENRKKNLLKTGKLLAIDLQDVVTMMEPFGVIPATLCSEAQATHE